jgi:hypothetical protein
MRMATPTAGSPDLQTFNEIVRRCHGMLAPASYRKIYEFGRAGGLIVEVGTALGAATAALAMGLRDSGQPGRVYTFDPMTGGPLRQISSVNDRRALVRDNLRHFEVEGLVDIVTDTLGGGLSEIKEPGPISVLMLDADGRIDRDLIAVADRLQAGTKLIIDDDADLVRLSALGGARLKVDQKMRLAHLLVETFKRDGLISAGAKSKDTYFGEILITKPRIDLQHVLEAYRQLVFGHTSWKTSERLRASVLSWMEGTAPDLLQRARVAYRNTRTRG